MKTVTLLVFSIVFTLLGVAGGYFAAAQRSPGHETVHEEPEEHKHSAEAPEISPQTLKNLGVTLSAAETSTYVKYRAAPAVVIESSTSSQPIFAPVGATVQEIKVAPESTAAAGTVLITLLRDPLPRATLTLTENIVKSTTEDLHRAVADLRKALRNVEIANTEIDRIKGFIGGDNSATLIPRKNLIELRYELSRAEQDLANSRNEFMEHGFAEEQIKEMESGKPLPILGQSVWKQTLERNGMWTPMAETITQSLPEDVRTVPWNIAAVGEITAAGLASGELVAWLKSAPDIGRHFQIIAGLLQQGQTLAQIKALYAQSAFAPVVEIRAPKSSPDWDVHEILVKPTQRVEAGAKLLTLENSRTMLLKSEPAGGETAAILNAHVKDSEIEATPLTEGSGPALKGLKISHIDGNEQSSGVVAFLRAANEPIRVRNDEFGSFRSWKLRQGQRYMLRIPVEKLENVYILPSDAIADDGPNKVAFIQDGDSFKQVKVEILYQDHEVVVIANNQDTEIFPGDSVVQHGAFGLSLALKAGSGGEEGGHHRHHH